MFLNVFNTLMYVGSSNCTARFMNRRTLIIYVDRALNLLSKVNFAERKAIRKFMKTWKSCV